MKIIEKAVMPDGTKIQLEDWSENNTKAYPELYGLSIGAYPVAKNATLFTKRGENFRLQISMKKYSGYENENVKADFEALKNGNRSLEDLADHFYNGEKDRWMLGMVP